MDVVGCELLDIDLFLGILAEVKYENAGQVGEV